MPTILGTSSNDQTNQRHNCEEKVCRKELFSIFGSPIINSSVLIRSSAFFSSTAGRTVLFFLPLPRSPDVKTIVYSVPCRIKMERMVRRMEQVLPSRLESKSGHDRSVGCLIGASAFNRQYSGAMIQIRLMR